MGQKAGELINLMARGEKYLNPSMNSILFVLASSFKIMVVIEIIAGFIVLIRVEIGGTNVAAWPTAITLTLLAGLYRIIG